MEQENEWFCPKDPYGHRRFSAPATEYHTWEVDSKGNFVADIDCHDSNCDMDYVHCNVCGESAKYGVPPIEEKIW